MNSFRDNVCSGAVSIVTAKSLGLKGRQQFYIQDGNFGTIIDRKTKLAKADLTKFVEARMAAISKKNMKITASCIIIMQGSADTNMTSQAKNSNLQILAGVVSATKRKGAPSPTKNSASSSSNSSYGISPKTPPKKQKSANQPLPLPDLFALYASEDDPELMDLEGISAFAEDVGLEADDIRLIVLLWKLGAAASGKPGTMSKREFISGMAKLKLVGTPDIKTLVPSFDPGFLDEGEFAEFFKFVFNFNLEGTNKTIEKDFAIDLLNLILQERGNVHLENFNLFLVQNQELQRITLDQFTSFLGFSLINPKDCSDYDDNEDNCAWPVLIDEFVDFVVTKKKS